MTVTAVNCITVYVTQCCSRDNEDGFQGQMGGSPKALAQHLAGETSLLGDYQSPTVVARAPVTS